MQKLLAELVNLEEDRVRANTDPEINRQLDAQTEHRLRLYAHQEPDVIEERLRELDKEWDIERFLETNASSLILGGLFLGATVSRKWFVVPFAVAGFLLQHAVQGYCPPLTLLRKRGVRTRREIERERYGLKALRGDFEDAAARAGQDAGKKEGSGASPTPRRRHT